MAPRIVATRGVATAFEAWKHSHRLTLSRNCHEDSIGISYLIDARGFHGTLRRRRLRGQLDNNPRSFGDQAGSPERPRPARGGRYRTGTGQVIRLASFRTLRIAATLVSRVLLISVAIL
jgi:hypothetical protein